MKHLLLFLLTLSTVHGQTSVRPVNDGLSNTVLIAEREGSYANQGGRGATAEYGEPTVGGEAARHTVWYCYTAPANGRCVFDLTDTQGLRAELRYPGNPAPTLPLQTVVDGTSNTLFPDNERLSVDLDRGQTVYLVVDAEQPFDFEWRFAEVVNDHWQDAETLPDSSGTIVRGNAGATLNGTETNLGLNWPGVWFEWTAPSTGTHHFDLVGSRQWDGSTYDGFGLRVYDSTSAGPANLVGSGSGSSLDNSTRVTINATAGHVYYLACDSGGYAPDSQLWLSWYPGGSAGVLAWAQSETRGSEIDGGVLLRLLKLRGDGDGSVSFISDSIDGTTPATAGVDYTLPGTLPLPTGTRSGTVLLPFLEDGVEEPQEAVGVAFDSPTGGIALTDGSTSTVFINETISDAVLAGLRQREVRVREGQTATLEVYRQYASSSQIAVGWRVQSDTCRAGIDMPAMSGTVYLNPGQMSATIAVPVYWDRVFEGPESFRVELSDNPQLGAIVDGASNTIIAVEDADFFVPRPGTYCGLLDTDGWGALVKCTVTGAGSASGTVDYRGVSYRFSGSFGADGQLVAAFTRANRVSLGLRLRFGEGWSRCAASLRDPDGDWADGWVRYLPYSKANPAPQAGRYTLLCSGLGGEDVPVPLAGASFVGTDGSVRFIGRTADNQTATFASRIGQSDPDGLIGGECAFSVPLYGKTGSVYGTCDLGLGPQQPGGETTLGWLKPWRPRDTLYPALPFQTFACQAVPYTPPATGERITEPLNVSLGDGSVRFINSGSLLDGVSNTLFVSERNQVTVTEPGNPLGCSIKIDPKTGTFSGKIREPESNRVVPFYGVFHQGAYGYGLGFFPGIERTGEVVFDDF